MGHDFVLYSSVSLSSCIILDSTKSKFQIYAPQVSIDPSFLQEDIRGSIYSQVQWQHGPRHDNSDSTRLSVMLKT
ncbi:hypothetical protein L6164_005622 [Bauhinia variegata]|uniref:Uncharacterized protein n=1 Tax=Bauhinia variegata TaxID=167791 RepID=A0ACB9PRW2_BAUVA|nr:hypothetical protein L6164_005622 [Bauhinia variegata]